LLGLKIFFDSHHHVHICGDFSVQPQLNRGTPKTRKDAYHHLWNYTSIINKLRMTWCKSATFLEDQYMSSLKPMPIAPLFLCGAHVSDNTLLTILEFLFKRPRVQKKGKQLYLV
jgi:hypothetical protein